MTLEPAVAIAFNSFFFSVAVSFDERSPKATLNFRDLTVDVADGLAEGVTDGVGVLDGLADGVVVGLAEGVSVGIGVGDGDGDATELSSVKAAVANVESLKAPAAAQSPTAGHDTELKPAFGFLL